MDASTALPDPARLSIPWYYLHSCRIWIFHEWLFRLITWTFDLINNSSLCFSLLCSWVRAGRLGGKPQGLDVSQRPWPGSLRQGGGGTPADCRTRERSSEDSCNKGTQLSCPTRLFTAPPSCTYFLSSSGAFQTFFFLRWAEKFVPVKLWEVCGHARFVTARRKTSSHPYERQLDFPQIFTSHTESEHQMVQTAES